MNSTVFIRIYKVHYSDIPVCKTLSINLKVCGKFTIESMRQECDSLDPSLLHLQVTVRFNRQEDALDAIKRYNNTRFMNCYSMKIAFYRPSLKQNRDKNKETEDQKTYRITSKERTVSSREEKVVERKRSHSFKRSPQRQLRRQSSSSSDTSTSSSSSNHSFSCKDIRSRLSTVRSKHSALPRRSEHASRSRSRYREKVKQAIKRRVTVVSSTSSSETSCTPVTSETDSSPSSMVGKHVRKISIKPRSEEVVKNINDMLRSIRDGPSDNDLTLKADHTNISVKKTEKETKKVKFSPIKFGHTPMTNQKTKVLEGRTLVIANSRKDSRRIVSMAPSQILPPYEIPGNNVKMDNQEIKSDCTASPNSCDSDDSIAPLGDKNVPRETDSKKENIEPDDFPVNTKELQALVEKTLLSDNNVDVPNQTRKVQFHIKNTSTLVKDCKMFPNPLQSNNLNSPNNSKASPEDIMSKRKRNKSEKSTISFISKIPSTTSSFSRKNIQNQRLYKSKSFHNYEVAGITANDPVQHNHHETTEQAGRKPDKTSLVSKRFVDYYQNKLINSPSNEMTPSEVHQISNFFPLKADDSKDCSVKEDRVGYGPSSQLDKPTTKGEEANNNEARSEHEHPQSLVFQPIGNEFENRSTHHKIQCDDTSSTGDSEAVDSDQSSLSDNLSKTSVSFSEDKSSIGTHSDESSLQVDKVIQLMDFVQSSVFTTDETLKEDLQKYNTHSCSQLHFSGSPLVASSSVVQLTNFPISNADTADKMVKDDLGSDPSEKTSQCLDQSTFNPGNPHVPQTTSCEKLVSWRPPVTNSPTCETLVLSKPQAVSKESAIQNVCCQQNIRTTTVHVVDPPVSETSPDSDLTYSAMDAISCDRTQTLNTAIPHMEPSESPVSVLRSETPLQQMDTTESTESLNKLKRPISEDIDHSEVKINTKPSTNPAKRQKQDDEYVCTLVKPHQMSFLLGEKEKLEKLYNEECRTVCNAVQLLVSQDPSLEKYIEKSLSQTLENIGEKYVSKLQETVLELSELET